MKSGRIVALVVGCLLLLPGFGILLGGGGLGLAYGFGRDHNGYFQVPLTAVNSPAVAVTAGNVVLTTDLAAGTWLAGALDTDIKLQVTPTTSDAQTFIGVGPVADVGAYLARSQYDEITGIDKGTLTYRSVAGTGVIQPPANQKFWSVSAVGAGAREIDWHATDGRWAVVIMNADGSPGVHSTALVQVKAGFLLPLAVILFLGGLLMTAGAVVLIVVGASGRRGQPGLIPGTPDPAAAHYATGSVTAASFNAASVNTASFKTASVEYPVVLTAQQDPELSRWRWLIKWFLAIPHVLVLCFLWPAFLVVTIVAGFSILFTGVYPRGLFDFNAGVLRWSWRVSYYAFNGGLGTDRYPPFSLGAEPGYPASLDIAYTPRLSRGLVLVKWWLLAIPHYLIVGLMVGNWFGWSNADNHRFGLGPIGGAGVLGLLVAIAAVILLFTGRYPLSLFNVILGMNRWIYRVIAYAALMTDQYPPFRLDQGGSEPAVPPVFPTMGPGGPRLPEPARTTTG